MELFDLPPRLRRPVFEAVLGGVPASLARELDTPETAALITALLDAGWRTGQVASRLGALPATADPAQGVLELLRALGERLAPDRQWEQEKALRTRALRSVARDEQPASDDSRERWIAQIRAELGGVRAPRAVPAARPKPACALCGGEGALFVTREVRLCTACVAAMSSRTAQTADLGATG